MKNIILGLVVVSLNLIFATGCSLIGRKHIVDFSEFEPTTQLEKQCVVDWLKNSSPSSYINSLRSLIDAEVDQESARYALKLALVFERPGKVRLELFRVGLNLTESMILANDGQLLAYVLSQRQGFAGDANYESVFRLTGLPFEPEELMLWMIGSLTPPENSRTSVKRDSSGDSYLVEYHVAGERRIRLLLNGNISEGCKKPDFVQAAVQVDMLGTSGVFLSKYNYVDENSDVPEEIEFEFPDVKVSGVLKVKRINLNADLEKQRDKLFSIELPAVAKIHSIGELEGVGVLWPQR